MELRMWPLQKHCSILCPFGHIGRKGKNRCKGLAYLSQVVAIHKAQDHKNIAVDTLADVSVILIIKSYGFVLEIRCLFFASNLPRVTGDDHPVCVTLKPEYNLSFNLDISRTV